MANMLYNGVELPDIESVWTDKETYPYAVITQHESDGTWELYIHSKPSTLQFEARFPGLYSLLTSGAGKMQIWKPSSTDNNTWVQAGGLDYTEQVDTKISNPSSELIWANFDIYDSQGTLYLAASDPVDPNAPTEPAWTFNLQDFLSGAASAAASRGVIRRTPIAYLYNGVQLPRLPVVDGYEYMAIVRWNNKTNGAEYGLCCGQSPFVIMTYESSDKEYLNVDNSENRTSSDVYVFDYLNGKWTYDTIMSFVGAIGGSFAVNGVPIWSDRDIPYCSYADDTELTLTYGEIYLTTSKPIPVYE